MYCLYSFSTKASLMLIRYRTLCFWLYAKPDALNARLDERVDRMLEVSDEVGHLCWRSEIHVR